MSGVLHNTAAAVDELMERASAALARMDYFETETLAMKAMKRARAANDFERMARICLPLQEGRRQRREAALDSGRRFILRAMPPRNAPPESGCYLLEPPLIGLQGREFRDFAERKGVAVLALVREPTTKAGKWPIVAVGGAVAAGGGPRAGRSARGKPARNRVVHRGPGSRGRRRHQEGQPRMAGRSPGR